MGTNLTCIPIQDVNLIPRSLVEQIKDREFEVDRFYEFGTVIAKNPLTILAVFANKENLVKGFLFGNISPLDLWLHINILSIDKKYQGKGIINEATNILKSLVKEHNLKGIKMSTTRPGAFKKEGYTRSKYTVMQWVE